MRSILFVSAVIFTISWPFGQADADGVNGHDRLVKVEPARLLPDGDDLAFVFVRGLLPRDPALRRQPGRNHVGRLVLAGGDGDANPASDSGSSFRKFYPKAVQAVQNSSLSSERKQELLNMLEAGKNLNSKSAIESNRNKAKKIASEAMNILNKVMKVVSAEG